MKLFIISFVIDGDVCYYINHESLKDTFHFIKYAESEYKANILTKEEVDSTLEMIYYFGYKYNIHEVHSFKEW